MSDVLNRVLICGRGYWGVGATVGEAIVIAKYLRIGDKAFWYPCTADTRISSHGRIYNGKVGEPTHGVIGRKSQGLPTFKVNKENNS